MSENPAAVDGSSGGTGATSDGTGDTGGPGEGSGGTSAPGEVIVEATGLTKQFDSGDPVIEDVDLTIHEGETTILVGPNGAGKTVLLCCLAGGLRPSAGTVEVFGRPPREAQSQFVFTLQDGLAVDELSGRENAAFYTRLHPAATDRWTEVADRLALDEAALHRRVGDYSVGMTRKLELYSTNSQPPREPWWRPATLRVTCVWPTASSSSVRTACSPTGRRRRCVRPFRWLSSSTTHDVSRLPRGSSPMADCSTLTAADVGSSRPTPTERLWQPAKTWSR